MSDFISRDDLVNHGRQKGCTAVCGRYGSKLYGRLSKSPFDFRRELFKTGGKKQIVNHKERLMILYCGAAYQSEHSGQIFYDKNESGYIQNEGLC